MSSETAFANHRCGLSFLKLKREWNVTAVRKQPRPVPEIPLLRSSNCQEIRARNSHRHLWLRLRHSRQEGKSMRSGARKTYVLPLTSFMTLGKPFSPLNLSSLMWKDEQPCVPSTSCRIRLRAGAHNTAVSIINNL